MILICYLIGVFLSFFLYYFLLPIGNKALYYDFNQGDRNFYSFVGAFTWPAVVLFSPIILIVWLAYLIIVKVGPSIDGYIKKKFKIS